MTVRVVLADDRAMVRAGFRAIFELSAYTTRQSRRSATPMETRCP